MLLDELGGYLASQGLGVVGASIFLGHEPPDPDAIVALHEYGGLPPMHVQGMGGPAMEMPRVQVAVRGPKGDYQAARTTAEAAYRALDAVANRTLSGVRYARVRALQSPFSLGPDANGRHKIVFNVEVMKEPS